MGLIQITLEVFGGGGGPNDDSIPAYADDKAPNGDWVLDGAFNQLMVANGTKVYGLQFNALSETERKSFFSLDANGKPKFGRVWFIADSGKGYDPFGQQCWLEWSHLRKVSADPEPQPVNEWIAYDMKIEGGKMWLKKAA